MSDRNKTILYLLPFLPNPRFEKRIAAALENHEVFLLCWDKDGAYTLYQNYQVNHKIIDLPTRGNPIQRLPELRKFAQQALITIKEVAPKVIHLQGLDMLVIARKYKKKYDQNVKIIYEVPDLHSYLVDDFTNPIKKLIQAILKKSERNFLKDVEKLIVTSQKYYDIYFKEFVPKEQYTLIENLPDLSAFNNYKPRDRDYNQPLTIGFVGAVRYKEQAKLLIEAAKHLEVELFFAGFEKAGTEIQDLVAKTNNATWYGSFNYGKEIAKIYERCDLIYSVYDADMFNVRVALPNKLYEAVYCELPIIVAKNTYLQEVVEEWGVGLAVDWKSPVELIEAIKTLLEKENYEQFVSNCQKVKATLDSSTEQQKYNQILAEII